MKIKQKKTSIAKRMSAYSTIAAATAVAGGTANAAEIIWDVTDITSGSFAEGTSVMALHMTDGSAFNGLGPANPASEGDFALFSGDFRGFPTAGLHAQDTLYVYSASSAYNVRSGVPLTLGASVSAGLGFDSFATATATIDFGLNLSVGETAFFGLTFDLGGNTHYGWAQISNSAPNKYVLHGFGYNDQADASSVTSDTVDAVPDPSSLALLALGATGLMRRRRQKAA
ncbi:MAG: PEP-CTERM sorting domain-containing protein [Rubritalea sp.]|tara:strand:- start:425 stop:1108 length:684 start_codon:yes stop_codon:yes gene_type:complete